MKEFDEDKAVAKMKEAMGYTATDDGDVYQILDLIFDYYDENGQLEIDGADDDSDVDIDEMVKYIAKYLVKAGCDFTHDQIRKAIEAEIEYEESLLQ